MKKVLYLGIDLPELQADIQWIHYPIIQVVPKDYRSEEIVSAFKCLPQCTHLVFTSKNGVRVFMEHYLSLGGRLEDLLTKKALAVGKKTAECARNFGMRLQGISQDETAEGLTQLMTELALDNPYFFWPHSALSRPVITRFFDRENYPYCACAIYDTFPQRLKEPPPLEEIAEIVFTSPSTVEAFQQFFGRPPKHIALKAIGPVTLAALKKAF